MEDLELVEFYAACNPPLLPEGVHNFMLQLTNASFQLSKKEGNKILEILYEPSGPWFKVITCFAFKSEVTNAIATLLSTITEENTLPLEEPKEYSDVQTTSFATPWSAFSASPNYQSSFGQWQFPVNMQELVFKTIWPRKFVEFNLEKMLHMQSRLDGSRINNPTIHRLDPLLGCTLSCNLRVTMLYLGTNSSQEVLDNAYGILDSLLDLTKQAEATTTQHVIYTTGPAKDKFSYRWLSHIGLDTRTFAQLPTDYQKLRHAVSIRTAARAPHRQQALSSRTRDVAPSKNWLTTLFIELKYPPKRAQKSHPSSEIFSPTNSSSPTSNNWEHTTESRPSSREDDQVEFHSDMYIGMDELLIFDMDDVSQDGNQNLAMQQHNPPSSVSLMDDDPPSNLASSMLQPIPPESEPAEIKIHRSRPHVIKLLEKHLHSLWPVLSRYPGFVTVNLQFGRFYLTDLINADVDVGNGPHRKMADLVRELESVDREQIGFSTILSRLRSDADIFLNYATSPWIPLGEDLIYQIECKLDDKNLRIDVDAKTFDFSCHGPTSELGCTLVHCVHRAWDLKLAVNQSSNLNRSPAHRGVGQAITNSLQISTAANGEHVFELITDREEWIIEAVRIRHMTRYRSIQTPGSLLCVAKFQALRPSEAKDKRCRWTIPPNGSPKSPRPESWFEAHISSSILDGLLKENVNLSLGEKLQWDESQQEAICDGLFEPALETLTQLDEVGQWNNNGLSGGKLCFDEANDQKVVFW
ncbi:hypothetical protein E4U21_006169 [Claviceps maximensis]|nr:hypothetical protein E4U21_006169 [Claviceps maximensis]